MKYTLDESVQEFSRRKSRLEKKRHDRVSKTLFSGVGVLSVMLGVALFNVTGLNIPGQGGSSYGSFLLGQDAGGYVIVAVIAFLLGILLTFAILHRNGRLKSKNKK